MFKDAQYIKIVESFKELKKDHDKMKSQGIYDKYYLMTKAQEIQNAVRADLNNFYDDKVEALRKKQEEIKQKYSVKTYEDPTAELLKRQDIERKFKLMNDEALKDLVKDSRQGKVEGKDSFFFDALQLELKSRSFNDEFATVQGVRNAYDVDSPWNTDSEFISAAEEIMTVNQARRTNLLWEGEGEERVVHNLNDI